MNSWNGEPGKLTNSPLGGASSTSRSVSMGIVEEASDMGKSLRGQARVGGLPKIAILYRNTDRDGGETPEAKPPSYTWRQAQVLCETSVSPISRDTTAAR